MRSALRSAPVRALKLIRREEPVAKREVIGANALSNDIVWQPRPEWLRKPHSRKNLWH